MDSSDNIPLAIPTFHKRDKLKSEMGMTRKKREFKTQHKAKDGGGGGGEGEDEDKVELEKKIMELQRIVPGGESLGIEKLFEQTAVYILALQCQMKAMNAVASFFEGLDKEKMKLGG